MAVEFLGRLAADKADVAGDDRRALNIGDVDAFHALRQAAQFEALLEDLQFDDLLFRLFVDLAEAVLSVLLRHRHQIHARAALRCL